MELQLQEELNSAITELIDLLSSIDEKKLIPFLSQEVGRQVSLLNT